MTDAIIVSRTAKLLILKLVYKYLKFKHMNPIAIFLINMVVALTVFVWVLLFSIRKRPKRPILRIALLSLIAVVGGMTFARITFGKELPWWIFYGIPAFVTFILPPIVLRMTGREILVYLPTAILMSPAIHIFFSFFFNWHDFMPLFYIPWWHDLI
jgi:hypothetical protein